MRSPARMRLGRSVGLVEAAAALSAAAEPDTKRAAQRIGSALQSLGPNIKPSGVDGDRALKTLMGALGDDTARGGPWGEASVATLWRSRGW